MGHIPAMRATTNQTLAGYTSTLSHFKFLFLSFLSLLLYLCQFQHNPPCPHRAWCHPGYHSSLRGSLSRLTHSGGEIRAQHNNMRGWSRACQIWTSWWYCRRVRMQDRWRWRASPIQNRNCDIHSCCNDQSWDLSTEESAVSFLRCWWTCVW